jgi:CRP/FNR family cyclic AMP-dependent transcriptional regulator
MEALTRTEAETIIRSHGWLQTQPEAFRDEVVRHSQLQCVEAGQALFRIGDPPGGIYGLVRGNVTMNTAPADAIPKLIQMSRPGHWLGEGSYFTRQPRRMEVRALMPSVVLHLPLAQMDRMTAADPLVMRQFSHILIATFDGAIRVIHDLQHQDPRVRVAAVLERATASGQPHVRLTQSQIGEMACATRRQVQRALHGFEASSWLRCIYGGVEILDPESLRALVERA